MRKPGKIAKPKGKLGVLTPGMGAVSTTFMAGVELIRKGHALPIGSLTQMGTVRLGKRTDSRTPKIQDFVPLANLDDLVFGGWDLYPDSAHEAASKAGVLDANHLGKVQPFLSKIRPMKAAFDQSYVKNLHGEHVKRAKNKFDLAEQLREDIRNFKKSTKVDRTVMVWCASTEIFLKPEKIHNTLKDFERAMKENHEAIAPSMLYGQTLMKTILSPGFKARMIGVRGWFSTNILGNRDGEVLDDPGSFKTKEESKLGALEYIFQPKLYPELYGDLYHKVRINYYPPRGDNKEGWDNIDIFGWLGYPMQIKVDFLCRDSILAAPIVLDLVLFLDLAHRAGMHGIQEWLSFYFKSPMCAPELYPEHDLFIQLMKLKNTLRWMMGEQLITHLGTEYYD
jgi:myo-inositol-1-phosphate synthase